MPTLSKFERMESSSIVDHSPSDGKQSIMRELKKAVLSHPTVISCHLSRQTDLAGRQTTVVYYSAKALLSPEPLGKHINCQIGGEGGLIYYIAVNIIPLKANGQVDEQKLHQVGIRYFEAEANRMQKSHGFDKIEQKMKRFHLSDLIPADESSGFSGVEETNSFPLLVDQSHRSLSEGRCLKIPVYAPKTMTEALLKTARNFPEKGCLYFHAGSYEEFQPYQTMVEEARCILAVLQENGFKAGHKVIIQVENIRLHLTTFQACILGGIIAIKISVPHAYEETQSVALKVKNIWKNLEYPPILTQSHLVAPMSKFLLGKEIIPRNEPAPLFVLRPDARLLVVESLTKSHPAPVIHHPDPDDIVFMQLSSGSTGAPKIIPETHKAIIAHIYASKEELGFCSDDVSLNWLTLDHVVSALTLHLKDIYIGSNQIHVDTSVILADPLKWLDLIEYHKVTHSWSPNFGFKLVADAIGENPYQRWDLSSMRYIMNAGEQVTLSVSKEFIEKTKPFGLRKESYLPAYGMAEVATTVSYVKNFNFEEHVYSVQKKSLCGPLRLGGRETGTTFIDMGPPIPGMKFRIVDDDNNLLPEGNIGRLQMAGQTLMPCYYANDEANLESFFEDGWFDSGDLGFLVNGRLTITGRRKEIIIVRGANFFCFEIEDIVSRVRGVLATFVAAVAVRDEVQGTDGVGIFFVPEMPFSFPFASSENVLSDQLIDLVKAVRMECSRSLGLSPTVVVPVQRDRFPKTTSGKIQRVQLKKRMETGEFDSLVKSLELSVSEEKGLPQWFFQGVWRPLANDFHQMENHRASFEVPAANTLIFCDNEALLSGLGQLFAGSLVIEVRSGNEFAACSREVICINPGAVGDYKKMWDFLTENGIENFRIIHCWNLGGTKRNQESQTGYASLINLSKTLPDENDVQLFFFSDRSQVVDEKDVCLLERSTLPSLISGMAQEFLNIKCRHIDVSPDLSLDDSQEFLSIVKTEILDGSKVEQICYRKNQRLTRRLLPLSIDQFNRRSTPLKKNGNYLITGGLGGIGKLLAAYLSEQYGGNILLIGRSPHQKHKEALEHLKKNGNTNLIYKKANVNNLLQVKEALNDAESLWGAPLDGVFHLAGVFPLRGIKEETPQSWKATLSAKVEGAHVLHSLLKDRPGISFFYWSSVYGFFNGAMTAAYSAANRFLMAFAHEQRRRFNLQSYSIGWSIWEDIGISRENSVAHISVSKGFSAMTKSEAFHSMKAALGIAPMELYIGLDDTKPFVSHFVETEPRLMWQPHEKKEGEKSAVAFSGSMQEKKLLSGLTNVWKKTLGLERIGIEDNFFEIGGNSMFLPQLLAGMNDTISDLGYQEKLELTSIFRFPSIARLIDYLIPKDRTEMEKSVGAIHTDDDIAIIGMSGRFPKAESIDEFWNNLKEGVDGLSHFSETELRQNGVAEKLIQNPDYFRGAPVLKSPTHFDASFFGYTPREAESIDPQQRLFLELAWEALESAGYAAKQYAGKIAVFGGVGFNTYEMFREPSPELTGDFLSLLLRSEKDFVTTRVSHKLNLKGASVNVQTACSTSLTAVHMACRSLLNGESDMALAGAVRLQMPHQSGHLYQKGGIFTKDGKCRAFDADATGMLFGNGGGMVLLKPLEKALQSGDSVVAVIRGSALNNDGSEKVGYTAPSVEGQSKVIKEALEVAGVSASSISYIEAHGTGTALGDPIEIEALTEAYGKWNPETPSRRIGSVKTNIGHLDVAAGMASLIKAALMLRNQKLVPTLNFKRPNPKIDFQTGGFEVQTQFSDWKVAQVPRRAGVSAFGFGGTNAHLILEEPPLTDKEEEKGRSGRMLPISARSPDALVKVQQRLLLHLQSNPHQSLSDVAFTLQVGRHGFDYRKNFLANNREAMIHELSSQETPTYKVKEGASVVFLFPGQGAQYPDMAKGLYEAEPVFREKLDECCELITPLLGVDPRSLLFPEYEMKEIASQKLQQTAITQPVLFSIEVALAQLWMSWGIRPEAMLGHSIGEYSAAFIAKVFTLEEAVELVVLRGHLMQKLPIGAMLSVSLPEQDIQPLLNNDISVSVLNSPFNTVVGGTLEAIEALEKQLAENEVECVRLMTSHAFHSHMLEPSLDDFRESLQRVEFKAPQIPLISNLTGHWKSGKDAIDPEHWIKHMRHKVRFSDGLDLLLEEGNRIFLEVGPGKTLTSLLKKQKRYRSDIVSLTSTRPHKVVADDQNWIMKSLGKLWACGIDIDWNSFHGNVKRRRVHLPTYPFQRKNYSILNSKSSTKAVIERQPSCSEWFYELGWKRLTAMTATYNLTKSKQWLILSDDSPVLGEIVHILEDSAQIVKVCGKSAQFDVDEVDAIDRFRHLMDPANSDCLTPDFIIYGWGLNNKTEIESTYPLLNLAQAINSLNFTHPIRLGILTTDIFDVTGSEKLSSDGGSLMGVSRVIPQELPNIQAFHIDLENAKALQIKKVPTQQEENLRLERQNREQAVRSKTQAKQVIQSLVSENTVVTIAVRGNKGWGQEYVKSFQPTPEYIPDFSGKGVFWITGGYGSLGLLLAEYLVSRGARKIVLTSRSTFPSTNTWESILRSPGYSEKLKNRIRRIQKIQVKGAIVEIASGDVSNKSVMEHILSKVVQPLGPLIGLIHGAGVIKNDAFGNISQTTKKDWDVHFTPKINGLKVLSEILPDEEVRFVWLHSSLSSTLGGLGAAAYAGANAFLDAFATAQNKKQKKGTRWLSLNWDGWLMQEDIAENDTFGQVRYDGDKSEKARLTILPQEGPAIFDRLQKVEESGISQIIISTGDLSKRLDQWVTPKTTQSGSFSGAQEYIFSEKITITDNQTYQEHDILENRPEMVVEYKPPRNDFEKKVIAIWGDLLGIHPIGIEDNFFDLGGDSLLSIRLSARLKKELGIDFSVYDLFHNPCVTAFSERFSSKEKTGIALAKNSKSATDAKEAADPSTPSAIVIQEHQFSYNGTASTIEKKKQMKKFYDKLSSQINEDVFGEYSLFLNFGYISNNDLPQYSKIDLPEWIIINRTSIKLVLELIGDVQIKPEFDVLDIGCGRGGTLSVFQDFFKVRTTTGLDLSSTAIDFNNNHHSNWTNGMFVEGDAENLPFEDESFDIVTNVESSHSYPNMFDFYEQVYRVLRPGGYFLYTDVLSTETATDYLFKGNSPTKTFPECIHYMEERLGFVMLRDTDITPNVLLSCDEVGLKRQEALTKRGVGGNENVIGDFLGVPGSKIYDNMKNGKASYRILKFQKISSACSANTEKTQPCLP